MDFGLLLFNWPLFEKCFAASFVQLPLYPAVDKVCVALIFCFPFVSLFFRYHFLELRVPFLGLQFNAEDGDKMTSIWGCKRAHSCRQSASADNVRLSLLCQVT